MCLILLAYHKHPRYPLVLAANRDEFYNRPSASADFWEDEPEILAGRDLQDMGTWMGITRKGRLAALTNYRDPSSLKTSAPSRGWLVRDFLKGEENPRSFLQRLSAEADRYNGFSLILGDVSGLYYFSNRGTQQPLEAGLHGLSNHLLDTPWPKVARGKASLGRLLSRKEKLDPEEIFDVLSDRFQPEDQHLPHTGVGQDWERILAPAFIASPIYGTRSSTVLLIDVKGAVTFIEKSFNGHLDSWMTVRFFFSVPIPE